MALGDAAARVALRELRQHHFRAALSALERAAALRPLRPEERLWRGLALVGAGRLGAARPLLAGHAAGARVLEAAEDLAAAEGRYAAALCQARAADWAGAARTLAGGAACGDGLRLFALCALGLGDRAAARAALLEALRADPSDSHAAALLTL